MVDNENQRNVINNRIQKFFHNLVGALFSLNPASIQKIVVSLHRHAKRKDMIIGMQDQEYLMISTATEMVRLREESVVCITSDGNYSHICAIGGESFIVSSQLGQIEQLIAEQLHSSYGFFVRIGRGLIINMRYLCYINISKHKLYLLDSSGRKYVQSASREALIQLKSITEKMSGNGPV